MAATDFHLVTDWRLAAPRERVWAALAAPEQWPSWWRAVVRVETLEPGDANGIGALRRMSWRTALPYTLTFDLRTTRVEPMRLIEGRPQGMFSGLGRWTLASAGDANAVRYEWIVAVEQPWMRALAPLLRPAFAWNHRRVMRWGEQDLAAQLVRAVPR